MATIKTDTSNIGSSLGNYDVNSRKKRTKKRRRNKIDTLLISFFSWL